MEVLPKDIICTWIRLLTRPCTGCPSRMAPVELLEAMLYKLKTGRQWCYLRMKQLFTGAALSGQGPYVRFNAWRKDGCEKAEKKELNSPVSNRNVRMTQ